ncbi:acetyltransferase [miscellaneous Crenarchaeota group archaeon SMTZ-80]|nr:MAG: acetyltransferase [miscellaneous Crenarchaeota group archaeon SMTZ-80]
MINRIKSLLKARIVVPFYTFQVRRMAQEVGKDLRVNGRSSVTKNTILGNNVNFNGMEIGGGGNVKIGNNFHSGPGCLMITQNHDYDQGDAIPYGSKYIYKDIIIEDNVWLGDRVIILGGVTIGEGAIIQAGSVVVSDIPKYGIAGGHPAKVFKYRNKEHYEKLKSEGKFL